MKSRITIEVDFDNNNQPVLQILKADSDDVRDKLVSHFTQQFGGSSWCNIKWVRVNDLQPNGYPDFDRIHITPIREDQFKEQAEIMLKQYELNEKWRKQQEKAKV